MQDYTKEEREDIESRVKKAEEILKELQLFPSAVVQKVKVGKEGQDIFGDQVICFLADSKYIKEPIKSPFK